MMQVRLPLLLSITALLGACATPDAEYPSLAVRDAERVSGTLEAPEPYVLPPIAPATIASAQELAASARRSHAEFLRSVPRARAAAQAARNSGVGSEAWSVAQVAIADLESARSQVMVALADLDRIYVEAATSGLSLEAIADERQAVSLLVEEENEAIQSLLATVGR